MLKLLRQPFPITVQINNRIRTALSYGLFVFLFLLVFRPFGLNSMPWGAAVQATFLYGGVCFVVLAGCFLGMPALFPTLFEESGWTVWKEILHTLFCVLAVTGGNILFTHFYFGEAFNAVLVLKFCWITFSVSILPITFLVLIRQMRLMRTFSRQAAELDRQLPALPLHPDRPEGPGDLLYAEAADNYVKIFYREGDKTLSKIIRSSLKKLEADLRGQAGIYRCHRTYLVNLEKVVHISGNAQGYKLHLEGVEQAIPVSRNLSKEVASLVTRPKSIPVGPSDL
jgi:hypothetical protein